MAVLNFKRYFIAQFVYIVGLDGEVEFEFFAAAADAVDESPAEVALRELNCHQVFDIVPEVVTDNPADAFVADDGKHLVLDGKVDEHAVALLCFVHAEFAKHFGSTVEHIATATIVNVDSYLARGVLFGFAYGCNYLLLFVFTEEVFGVGHDY